MNMPRYLLAFVMSLVAGIAHAAPGFLVVAPDRGFTGNEVVRDAVATFSDSFAAQLVFVTEKGTTERLDQAYSTLSDSNPIVLMPFYLTSAHPDMAMIEAWLDGKEAGQGRPFGHSAPALALLGQSLRAIEGPAQTRLVLIGHGAKTKSQAKAMEQELRRMLDAADDGLGFAATDVVVWTDAGEFTAEDYEQKTAALNESEAERTVVLPFHLGPHLDSMMGFTPRIQAAAPEGMTVMGENRALSDAIARWLQREAARYQSLEPRQIGVVVHAHGADWQWNETMRQGASPLAEDYLVEYAFSMGDPPTLEHAVRHLEERGAEAVVIVRVFGMASSFRDGIVRFIGQAWETCESMASNGHHHGHGSMDAPAPLLQTNLPVVTVGGLEDHPLYAKALYQRALAISEQPSKETIVLVAHGLGNKKGNAHWRKTLDSIREQMLELGGDQFRAIKIGLWSEDWPELRQSAVEHVRALVEKANENDGRALVIPARTLGQGPADEYLDGLEYVLGEGFSPHPLFADWLRSQVAIGVERIRYDESNDWRCE